MNASQIFSSILSLIAGIGIFLVACSMMSTNLESIGSSALKKLFSRASSSRLIGVLIGTAGTAAIQSSGATTVMVIGFLNAGIMSLAQAATIIFGANVGTTVTGHIVALGMLGNGSLSTTVIFSALTGVGAFIALCAKDEKLKTTANIVTGFGMLFVGLAMMSGAMECFGELESIKSFLASIKSGFLLIIVGAVLTAVIQSSSVMTSIAITLTVAGLISLDQGIFITMGSNIGSCIVALLAGMTSGRDAKRAAVIHLIFNVGGVILFSVLGVALSAISGGTLTLGTPFMRLFPNAPQTQLAFFHTVFNIAAVIVALPLTDSLVTLATRIIPDAPDANSTDEPALRVYYIDDKLLITPPIAVAQLKKELVNMADIAMHNFAVSLDMICEPGGDASDFAANEAELNHLNTEIVRFLSKLSRLKLNSDDSAFVSSSFHTVSDIERIGDYAENIIEYAEMLKQNAERFSDKAIDEVRTCGRLIDELFSCVMAVYANRDASAIDKANQIEDRVDRLTEDMAASHIKRLNEGVCTPNAGAQYLSLSSDAERVADHLINIMNDASPLIKA